jgi:hypothetical protein
MFGNRRNGQPAYFLTKKYEENRLRLLTLKDEKNDLFFPELKKAFSRVQAGFHQFNTTTPAVAFIYTGIFSVDLSQCAGRKGGYSNLMPDDMVFKQLDGKLCGLNHIERAMIHKIENWFREEPRNEFDTGLMEWKWESTEWVLQFASRQRST